MGTETGVRCSNWRGGGNENEDRSRLKNSMCVGMGDLRGRNRGTKLKSESL